VWIRVGWKLPVAKVVALLRVGDGKPSREVVAGVVNAVQRVVSGDEISHDDFKFAIGLPQ
jgi:hypothetical protein